ncbi:MAG TPA: hypothetical protein VGQ36_16385 [Thermoanaerobaculia bacterium]|nr:hypothetical protein [Thermoanaerobaculia bacterium]
MRKRRTRDEGYVLMLVIIIMAIVFMLLMVASTQSLTTTRVLHLRLTHQGQALNAAHAGLVEGLDYFRRQTPPVNVFNPQRNLLANPPIDETDLVTVPPSIQRDFIISSVGKVWGHYELVQGNANLDVGVADITQNRRGSTAGSGSIWRLQSRGSVYVRNDPNVAYNVSPNLVISSKLVQTEIQRVGLNLPNEAAILSPATVLQVNANRVGLAGATRARVVGGTVGPGIVTKGNVPVVVAGATLSGTPGGSGLSAGMDLTINGIFNLSTITDLAAIADHNATLVADLPAELPMRLVVLDNGAVGTTYTFDAAHPLRGSGILVVNGNLTVNGGPSSYNGVIYVTGNYSQIGPSTVNGSIVVSGANSTVTISGSTEFAEVYSDRFMRRQVATQLGQFRFARPAFIPCPAGDPKCDSKFAEN